MFKESWVKNKIIVHLWQNVVFFCLPFYFPCILHTCEWWCPAYRWKIKPLYHYSSTNKMLFPMCILKIIFTMINHIFFSDIGVLIFFFKQGQAISWILWNAFRLSLYLFSLMNLSRAKLVPTVRNTQTRFCSSLSSLQHLLYRKVVSFLYVFIGSEVWA